MKLQRATTDHLAEIMSWFPDRLSCEIWGGPHFRFPFTSASFLEDMRLKVFPSYVLVQADDDPPLGFGQYYLRAGRCHLGRLVISPEHRGQNLGKALIDGLVELGLQDLAVEECSLFVAEHNPAMRLYERLGFVRTEYPEDDPTAKMFAYMAASAVRLRDLSSRSG